MSEFFDAEYLRKIHEKNATKRGESGGNLSQAGQPADSGRDEVEIARRHAVQNEQMDAMQKEAARQVVNRNEVREKNEELQENDDSGIILPERSRVEMLLGDASVQNDMVFDLEWSLDENNKRNGILVNGIFFNEDFNVSDDGSSIVYEQSHESNLRVHTSLLEGIKNMMAKDRGDDRFRDMSRQDFVTYAMLKLLPFVVRVAIAKAIFESDPNKSFIIDILLEEGPDEIRSNISLEDILAEQLKESREINKVLHALKDAYETNDAALLYGMSWLLMDRMDLRHISGKQTFRQALQEDEIYNNKDALLEEGKHMVKRERTKHNDKFR